MVRPVKKNILLPARKAVKVKKLSGKARKKALELAQGNLGCIEILDENSAIIHNSARNRKESEEKKGNK